MIRIHATDNIMLG